VLSRPCSRRPIRSVRHHRTLCELSGNPKLQEVHHRLEGEIGRFQSRTLALRGSVRDWLTEHRAIVAAIRLRDVDRAAALTADHIRVPARKPTPDWREAFPRKREADAHPRTKPTIQTLPSAGRLSWTKTAPIRELNTHDNDFCRPGEWFRCLRRSL